MAASQESLEQIQSRHRRETKDLQGRITQKKKNASKKTRKGVNSECEELERSLKERHAQELSALNGNTPADEEPSSDDEHAEEVDDMTEKLAESSISTPAKSEDGDQNGSTNGAAQPKKRNRAKERLARRAEEQAAAVEAAKLEALSQPDVKEMERKKISAQITSHGLVERLIRPDGHCLFSAVADQLVQVSVPLDGIANGEWEERDGYKFVRDKAAGYMEGHPEDFEGFLEEPLKTYVEKIRGTAEWGGHLELMALSKAYEVEICVLQDGPMQIIEPGEKKEEREKIWLAYYRHGFGLGEHYNSLRKAKTP